MCVMSGFESSVGTVRARQRQRAGETPRYWYMDCSSQTPYLGQPVQSEGWVARMSSIAILRTWSAVAAWESTTMPSSTWVLQAGTAWPEPFTSTAQSLQPPTASRSGCLQRCGMKIPASSAASSTDVPSAASTSLPSMVSFIMSLSNGNDGLSRRRAPPQTQRGATSHELVGASPTRRPTRTPSRGQQRSRRRCGRS